jgi:hypothetical protein
VRSPLAVTLLACAVLLVAVTLLPRLRQGRTETLPGARVMTTPATAYTDSAGASKAREHVLGTFIKTPTTHATEILGMLGFDFVVIDQEHAPFDANTIDVMVLAARASDIAPIVRVGDPGEANILSVLDCGASGILVPHVDSADKARAGRPRPCRYRGGRRGFANTTRAGRFGEATFAAHMADQDARVTCIAMIEDVARDRPRRRDRGRRGHRRVLHRRGDLNAAIGAPSMTSAENPPAGRADHGGGTQGRDAGGHALARPRRRGREGEGSARPPFMYSSDQGMLKQAAAPGARRIHPTP